MLLAFAYAQQYADNSAIPRYCADREGVIERVGLILTSSEPVGSKSRRPFIVAAKLIFLIPRSEGETVLAYQERLREHLLQVCR